VLPPLVLGILDQFVSARLLDRYPQLYSLGQTNRFFRMHVFTSWILNAVYHSLVLYIGGSLFFVNDGPQSDGIPAGKWVWGAAMYGAVLLTVLGKASLVTNNWTKYHVLAIPGSMVIWLVFVAVYGTIAPKLNISMEYFGVIPRLFSDPMFWLQMPTLAIFCLLRDFVWKFSKRLWRPEAYHHVQEYNIQDYRPRYAAFSLCPFFTPLRAGANR
jgi:phospholipid-transporting ATPase